MSAKEILQTDKDLRVCPFCKQPVKLYREQLWTDGGHGYFGCYDYVVECCNLNCHVQPRTKAIEDIYRKPEEAIDIAIERWNDQSEKKMEDMDAFMERLMED